MAYKFQLGAARLSGSVIQTDGDGDLRATTVDSLNASNGGIADAGAIAGATTIAASGLASLDGGINVNDDFTVDANGGVVAVGVNAGGAITGATTIAGSGLASLGSLAVDDTSTIGCDSDTDIITLDAQEVSFANDVDVIVGKAGGLNLADGAVTSTAAELNLLDAIARGSIIVGNSSGASALLGKGAASTFLQSDGTDVAYVAMSGDATLSAGALTIADNAVSLAKMAGITRGSIISGDASGDPQYLAKGAASTFLQSDGTDVAYVALSGDATLSAGALTIADNAVTLAKMAGLTRGSIIIGDASGDPSALAKGAAHTFLQSDGTDTAYVAMSGDATLSAGAITLAAAQTNVATITNAGLILSGNAGNKIDMTNAAAFKIVRGGSDKLLVNDTGVTIDGNLTVNGVTTTVNSTTINISKSFTFEGDVAGDSKTTVLDSGLPTANTTVKLPTLAAGTYHLPVLVDAPTAASSLVTAAEFAVLDGDDSATSVTIADSDQMILNDAGTMIQIAMSDVKTYAGGAAQVLEVAIVADGANLVSDKLQYVADRDGSGQNVGLTLPASAAGLVGKSIYIKAGNLENSAKITVATAAGDQKIDGVNSIILESPFASVRLVYVAADDWRVF